MNKYAKRYLIDAMSGMAQGLFASLLIGSTVMGRGSVGRRAFGMVVGAFIFRLVYTIALRLDMPAFMLKFVSAVIVVLAISVPYLKSQWPQFKRRMAYKKAGE